MATRHGHLSYKLLDKLGVEVSTPIYVKIDDSQTIATAISEANLLGQAIDPITDSQILETRLTFVGTPVSGAKSAPASTAENERTGLFNFSQSAGPYRFGVDIPGFADSKISSGKINLADADVASFLAAMVAAGTALTPESTSLYTLVALLDALLSFRKHRKAESRRSIETP